MMVIVVTALVSIFMISVVDSNIIGSRSVTGYEISQQAYENAESCVEEGLERIRQSSSYTGTFSLTLNIGDCDAAVTGAGVTKTILGIGTVGDYSRQIQATTTALNPVINIDSWQETS